VEHRYIKTFVGKIHAALAAPTIPIIFIGWLLMIAGYFLAWN